MLLNAREFSSVQEALNAAKDGDRLYFPSLDGATPGFYQAPAGGWTISKRLELFGDGPGNGANDTGTTVKPNTKDDHVFVLQAPVQNIYIHDMKIKLDAQPGADGLGDGIHCVTTAGNALTEVTIERVQITNLGRDGVHIEGADLGAAAVIFLRIKDCEAVACRGEGLFLKNVVQARVEGGFFNVNRKHGAYCTACSDIQLIGASFENNQAAGTAANYDTQLRLTVSHGFNLISGHFEEFDNNAAAMTALCVEDCLGGHVAACTFGNAAGVAGSRGIIVLGASRGVVIESCQWSFVDTLIFINPSDGNTGCVVMPQGIANSDANSACTISIPDTDLNGNFAFVPTTKTSSVGAGLLLPRTTTAARDGIPAGILQRGIVLYNSTTGKLNFYDGTAWRVVTSA